MSSEPKGPARKDEKKKKKTSKPSSRSGSTTPPPVVAAPVPKPDVAEKKAPVAAVPEKKKKSKGGSGGSAAVSAPAAKPKPAAIIMQAAPLRVEDDVNAEDVDDDDGYGSDGFEDYDDDFEADDDNTTASGSSNNKPVSISGVKRATAAADESAPVGAADMSAVQEALARENAEAMERARAAPAKEPKREAKAGRKEAKSKASAPSSSSSSSAMPEEPAPGKHETESKRRAPPARKYLNFGLDLSSGVLAADDPRLVRVRSLKQHVQFSQERFVAFESPPLTEYELYLRSLRSANSTICQQTTQSNEDSRSVEVQTEPLATADKEAQFQNGDDDTQFENLIASLTKRASQNGEIKEAGGENTDAVVKRRATGVALSRFLTVTSAAVEGVLVESEALRSNDSGRPQKRTTDSSSVFDEKDSFTELGSLVPGAVLQVVATQSTRILGVFKAPPPKSSDGDGGSEYLAGKSFVCVWDALSPKTSPQILVADSNDVTCVYSSQSTRLVVVGGSREGNVVVWDCGQKLTTRELQAAVHFKEINSKSVLTTFRFPALSRHLTEKYSQMHSSSVLAVLPIPTMDASSSNSTNLQFSTVDDRGFLCFWLLSQGDSQYGHSLNDEGLSLICSSTIAVWEDTKRHLDREEGGVDLEKLSLDDLLNSLVPGPSVLGLAHFPYEPNIFLVHLSDGTILKRSRFGAAPPPVHFTADSNQPQPPAASLAPSPFLPGYFLAGCIDGSVHLYRSCFAAPLLSWDSLCLQSSAGEKKQSSTKVSFPEIVEVRWSPRRATVFFVLDLSGNMHAFDLLESVTSPVLSVSLATDLVGVVSSSEEPSFSIGTLPSRCSFITLKIGGVIYFRLVEGAFDVPLPDEAQKALALLENT